LRGSSREQWVFKSKFRKPVIIFVIDFIIFIAISASILVIGPMTKMDFYPITLQLLIATPSIILFAVLLWGAMWELGQTARAVSSDVVSWLPIKPLEYVLGSSFSTVYIISLLLSGVFGLTMALSILVGIIGTWILFVILTLLTAFSGAFVVEIMRSITNRVSSSFYKRGGRSAIVGRFALTIGVIVIFSIAYGSIFSPEIMSFILTTVVSGISTIWFFPVVWPSLAIISNLQADLTLSLAYSFMSVLFVLVLLWIGLQLRAKYWILSPVSIKVTHKEYLPKNSFLNRFGFTSAEVALIIKDFKSLARRKEIMMAVAMPTLMIGILYTLMGMFEENPWMILSIPIYFSMVLSMFSIGQEGDGILNIYSLPIKEKEIINGKLAFVFLSSLVVLIVIIGLTIIFIQPSIRWLSVFAVAGLGLVVESGLWWMVIGTRYADFTTIPRSRFINPVGTIKGILGFIGIAIITILPLLLYTAFLYFFDSLPILLVFREAWMLPYWLLATVVISIIVSFMLYRLAKSEISKLCKEPRY
jgi:hypothetical protein